MTPKKSNKVRISVLGAKGVGKTGATLKNPKELTSNIELDRKNEIDVS